MSVFDLPRLHFHGSATTHLPTGARSGLVDLATNTALTDDGRPFPAHRPPTEYHDHLDRLGPRYGSDGRPAPDGPFSAAKGEDFAGNGHFSIDARIVAAEGRAGDVDTTDPVVGRGVDMWGHYNEYLATTVNRARVFDVDPSSDWTTTLMVGQFSFGRDGRSHDVGYMATGAVHGFHPPRWHNSGHAADIGDHWLAGRLRRSVVHQFVVAGDEELTWLEEADASPAVRRLRATVATEGIGGLVVQFALSHLAAPDAPDRPGRWRLRGTIAPWRPHEPRTYPAGRLLVPDRRLPGSCVLDREVPDGRVLDREVPDGRVPGSCSPDRAAPGGLHNLTVEVTDEHVTLNMITALPTTGAEAGSPVPVDVGDLELRTADTGRLVARIPRQAYLGDAYALAGGLVTVPAELPASAAAGEALHLVGTAPGGPAVHLREKEINVQTDDASLFLEHPSSPDDADHDVDVLVRSFVRGRPAAVAGIGVRQYFNPRALPRDPAARSPEARSSDIDIVRLRAGRRDGSGTWSSTCALETDDAGHGWFTLRGAAAGTARVLLSTGAGDLPCDADLPGSAALGHDHDDALGYWPGAGHLAVRVLPDDRRLSGTGQDEATFDLLYTEVFAFYEQLYSFMKAEVFSLADRCKVETYAKLIWQMCDPRNKAKTYYMPPTRDLSEPKARLLLTFLRAQQAPDEVLVTVPATSRRSGRITTRGGLVRALRDAAALELAVMLQYLYAAYSVPTHGAGLAYVRQGTWTPEQLRLACGDGGETRDGGIRGTLLDIAREEMIHFLLVNNVLTAVGEPFHVPRIDFSTINHRSPVPLDFSLERLGAGSVERFTLIERPDGLVGEVRRGDPAAAPAYVESGDVESGDGESEDRHQHPYASLSELYADIREGLRRVPGLFLVEKGRGGGEHHLFLRESVNRHHPDYQLEVDDLTSALFAIDVITEQGEGGVLAGAQGPPRTAAEPSHYEAFLRIGDLLRDPPATGTRQHHSRSGQRSGQRSGPRWSPAYPVVRNPTLGQGNPAMETVTDPDARTVMRLFNRSYFMALQLMVQHFGERPDASLRRSDLMNAAIDMMTGLMRPLAELLVTLPSGRRGTTAGPSFELTGQPAPTARPDVARRGIALRLDHLAAECGKSPLVPDRVGRMSAFWADHFRPPSL
ncbi:ferritin-like domain-containing protein [Streptomyces yaizuensis]|uniref:VioB - polyketide synthase n=1 Tax=Streptomyces yaizuensis TaxID=2989713 RepID=A0ABQ5NWV8_9ACTN|nr:ferritin-like domain-containing protein [Streptomyces sp. YSPA8]GLF94859.1 VioB - polyketide synthase [Streptomyces sp. YSPA8]